MWDSNDKYLDVLQNIESAIAELYEIDKSIIDSSVMAALNKSKVAIQQKFGFGKGRSAIPDNEREMGVINAVVNIGLMRINKINDLKLDEYVKLIDKISRSVDTHRQYGIRGYYEFIKKYV